MKTYNKIKLILFFIFSYLMPLHAQDMQKTLFAGVEEKLASAKQAGLELLSPGNFEEAFSNYKEASQDFEKGANLKGIQEKLANVVKYLDAAEEKAEVAKITLRKSIEARNDAKSVEAEIYAADLWKQAEKRLRNAGEEVEDGDIPDAENESAKAEELFKEAELKAIKDQYLGETVKLINKAKSEDIDDYAPLTLQKSLELVNQAEKELNENRYDTDLPRNLAQQAKYEVNHAMFLANFIEKFEDSDKSMEQLLLSYEEPMQKISSHFDYETKFDQPFENIANEIVQKIVELKSNYQEAMQNNMDLKQEIKILQDQLGGLSKEKSELDSKMAKLAEFKAKFEKINSMFSKGEAEVFREGNNIYIRLKGLSFPVGKSIIESENFGLLTKAQNAIREFPNSTIVVEGHTDSYGSDEKNLELSQERAAAVKKYFLANMNLDQKKIISFGYGESKPIANNETKEGRAINRRIDLIIQNAE
jgi:outer membrane protein OmpA-like peptidoglycan-associated protein